MGFFAWNLYLGKLFEMEPLTGYRKLFIILWYEKRRGRGVIAVLRRREETGGASLSVNPMKVASELCP